MGLSSGGTAVPGLGMIVTFMSHKNKNCHRYCQRAPKQIKGDFSQDLLSQGDSCKMNDFSSENGNDRERERSHTTPKWDCLEKSEVGETGGGLQRETWDLQKWEEKEDTQRKRSVFTATSAH